MTKRRAALLVVVVWAGCTQEKQVLPTAPMTAKSEPGDAGVSPPKARREPVSVTLHGDTRVDEYAWVKTKSPEVEQLLTAENAYTDSVLASLEPLRATIKAEYKARRPDQVDRPLMREHGYQYVSRTSLSKPFGEVLRQPLDGGALEPVVDLNVEFKGKPYARLAGLRPSPDAQRVAWMVDLTGGLDFTLHVREMDGGTDWPQVIERAGGAVFAADSKTLLYATFNDARRNQYVWRLDPGADAGVQIYDEKDERFGVHVGKSNDETELQITSASKTTSETRVLDAKKPRDTLELIWPRVDGCRYEVSNHGSDRVILDFPKLGDEGHVVVVPRKNVKAKPIELVKHTPAQPIDSLDVYASHYVVWSRVDGKIRGRVVDWKTKAGSIIEAKNATLSPGSPDGYDSKVLPYYFESLVQPEQLVEYDLKTGATTPRWTLPVLGFDAAKYETFEIAATAKDGTRVPITIARKKGVPQNGPAFLYAYGSYGASMDPSFDPRLVSMLDRGVTYALAHIRGGGEFGDPWHQAGRMGTKMNTFTDFISCAETLIAEKYTTPQRLAIGGGSAGGLLMGAVLNLRPELFKAALVEVPFVDVISTMLDTSLPLTVEEFEEWGNPTIAEQYGWMRAYSPYENIKAQAYPAILVRSGYNDSQVLFHEPTKWVQRLRERRTDDHRTLLWMSMESGHGGKANLDAAFNERARLVAWVLSELGIQR